MIAREQADIDAYEQALKENKTGVRETTTTKTAAPIVALGTMVTPSRTVTDTTREKVGKHSEAEMEKMRKRANAAKFAVYMYNTYFDKNGVVNMKKLKEVGYFDENGNPTPKFMKEISKIYKHENYSNEDDRIANSEHVYNLYMNDAPTVNTAEHDQLLDDFSGNSDKVNIPGLPNSSRGSKLNRYNLAVVRKGSITGTNKYDADSLPMKF